MSMFDIHAACENEDDNEGEELEHLRLDTDFEVWDRERGVRFLMSIVGASQVGTVLGCWGGGGGIR
jgi:hypothetical protein